MTSSKLIRGDALSHEYVAWNAPEVREEAERALDAAADLDDLRRQATDRGFAEGHAAGLAAGRQELTETLASLECVLNVLARPLEELDVRVEEEIVALVKAVAGQLVRRELKIDPSHIVGVIREGLAALPLSAEEPVVKLHPEDADVVRRCLSADDGDRPWRIVADPLMQRGGCLVTMADSQIDGRLETRLGRVVATMFEGERADDEQV